MKTKTNQRGSR